jgi:hypothetical protein
MPKLVGPMVNLKKYSQISPQQHLRAATPARPMEANSMMKYVSIVGLAAALSACQPNAQTDNPAIARVNGVSDREHTTPATGASSFTEAQAQGHLRNRGYSNITPLVRTDSGDWVGTGTLDGRTLNVSVDYQGNVVVIQ